MPIETPEYQQPATAKDKVPDYMKNSELIKGALGIDDTPENWKNILDRVRMPLAKPETSALKSAVVQMELNRKYMQTESLRRDAASLILAVQALAEDKKIVTPVHKRTTMRYLARYLDARDAYERLGKWKQALPSEFPLYLTEFVRDESSSGLVLQGTDAILRMQYDVKDKIGIEDSPQVLVSRSNEILVNAKNRRISMFTILNCLNGIELKKEDQPYVDFLQLSGYYTPGSTPEPSKEDINATKLIVGYIAKNLQTIETVANTEGVKVEQLTIVDALECCLSAHPLAELASEVQAHISGVSVWNAPDLREVSKKVSEKMLSKKELPNRMVQAVLAPMAKLDEKSSSADRTAFQANAEKVAQFFLEGDAKEISLSRIETHLGPYNEAQRKMIVDISNKIRSPDMVAQIQQALFVPKDESQWKPMDKNIVAALQKIIGGGDIKAREAFELFYLSSTTGGMSLPLSYAGIRILDEHGEGIMAFDVQHRALRKLADLTLTKVASLPENLSELGLTKEQSVEFSNMVQYLKESGSEASIHWLIKTISFLTSNWDVIAMIGAVPASIAVWKIKLGVDRAAMRNFAFMGIEEAKQSYKGLSAIDDARIKLVQDQIKDILTEQDGLPRIAGIIDDAKTVVGKGLHNEARRIYKSLKGDLGETAKALKSKYGNASDVAHDLQELGTPENIQKALKAANFTDLEITKATSDIVNNTRQELAVLRDSLKSAELQRLGDMADQLSKRFGMLDTAPWANGQERAKARGILFEDAKTFQKELNTYCAKNGEAARESIIKRLFPSMNDEGVQAVLKAHLLTDNLEKFELMKNVINAEEAKRLMRLGIAGTEPIGVHAPAEISRQNSRPLVQSLMKDKIFNALAKDAPATQVERLLNGLDDEALHLVEQSSGAKKLLAGALSATDATDMNRIVSAANSAAKMSRTIRIGLNAAGAAGDVFELWMAYADWQANGERIINTTNPELKALYQNAYALPLAEGATSLGGLVLGGIAIESSLAAGSSTLTALGATGGAIMMPVGLAVMGGRYYYKALEEGQENWLTSLPELLARDNADLLAKLHELEPEAQSAKKILRQLTTDSSDGADSAARMLIYEAYFTKNIIPPARRMTRSEKNASVPEADSVYMNRIRQQIANQLLYIKNITKGSFGSVTPHDLDDAVAYAELISYKQDAQTNIIETALPNGKINRVNITGMESETDPKKLSAVIREYQDKIVMPFAFEQLCQEAIRRPEENISALIVARFKNQMEVFSAKTELLPANIRASLQTIMNKNITTIITLVEDGIRSLQNSPLNMNALSKQYRLAALNIEALTAGDLQTYYNTNVLPPPQTMGSAPKSAKLGKQDRE
ncbi:MAG: hypothetical protein JWM56_407 [Candidatus Peribacteria bacterium]|nr:hypothetical protein [Candidatus Peribacteria bacterium]